MPARFLTKGMSNNVGISVLNEVCVKLSRNSKMPANITQLQDTSDPNLCCSQILCMDTMKSTCLAGLGSSSQTVLGLRSTHIQ